MLSWATLAMGVMAMRGWHHQPGNRRLARQDNRNKDLLANSVLLLSRHPSQLLRRRNPRFRRNSLLHQVGNLLRITEAGTESHLAAHQRNPHRLAHDMIYAMLPMDQELRRG